jgi:hypothetical protein
LLINIYNDNTVVLRLGHCRLKAGIVNNIVEPLQNTYPQHAHSVQQSKQNGNQSYRNAWPVFGYRLHVY